jgi:hypothetical protein
VSCCCELKNGILTDFELRKAMMMKIPGKGKNELLSIHIAFLSNSTNSSQWANGLTYPAGF